MAVTSTLSRADWEVRLTSWSAGPSESEQERCDNAVKVIREAVDSSSALNSMNIRVFAQGSYKNRTNVRKESDVDVAIVCDDVFFSILPEDRTRESFGITASNYTFRAFKDDVESALVDALGRKAVTRGNKAIDIKANHSHVEADAVPYFLHRRYSTAGAWLSGVELRPDNDALKRVINWPVQHYENGVKKHSDTLRRFKKVVRILKRLNYHLQDEKILVEGIPSFLIECLVWNVPDSGFNRGSLYSDLRAVLALLFNNTMKDEDCKEWGEVSELKYLFRSSQKWTRSQAHSFVSTCWDYIGFTE